MLTLQCLWCDHRNPAGANFCNACGTPLYLKPCKHCDTVNQRAAVHCRSCGEAFSFDFVAAAELEAHSAAEAAGDPDAVSFQPASSSARLVRASALAAGLVVAVAVSSYYVYRQPPSLSLPGGFDQAQAATTAAQGELTAATLVLPMALPVLAPLPEYGGSAIRDLRARVEPRRGAAPARKRSNATLASAARPRMEKHAAGGGPRTIVAAAHPKAPLSCAEGVALASSCDVRTLAKGN